jgi:hypothetical protein
VDGAVRAGHALDLKLGRRHHWLLRIAYESSYMMA